MVLLDGAVVDRDTWIVDGLVHHAERIRLRRPLKIVDRLCPVALSGRIDLVDGDDLARLRLGHQLLVVEAPPRRRVAAECLSGMGGVRARARLHVHDPQFDHVAGLGVAHVDRTGADVHAESLAGAAPQQLAVDRTGAAPVHALLVLGPEVDALGAGIALDHALGVVVGVMGQRLDRHVVAGIDLDDGFEQLAEIAPMDGVGGGRHVMMLRLALPRRDRLGGGGRDQRHAAGGQGRRASGGDKRAFQEAAPFGVEIVEQLLAVELEVGAIAIIACTHWRSSLSGRDRQASTACGSMSCSDACSSRANPGLQRYRKLTQLALAQRSITPRRHRRYLVHSRRAFHPAGTRHTARSEPWAQGRSSRGARQGRQYRQGWPLIERLRVEPRLDLVRRGKCPQARDAGSRLRYCRSPGGRAAPRSPSR